MKNALKAEFRKIVTIRSTYLILAGVLALELIFGFYISGWRAAPADLHNPNTLTLAVQGAVGAVSVFAALIALLLMAHEYRYNTIMYTLTAANSRSKVLLAKVVVITLFSLIFTLVVGVLSPLLTLAGMHLHGLALGPQTLHYSDLIWRSLLFGWGYAMAGLLMAILIRNQVGAIIALFVAPGTIESLLGLLLKKNVVYLPFSALHHVLGDDTGVNNSVSSLRAAAVFTAYLLVTWIAAWVMFLRKDAN